MITNSRTRRAFLPGSVHLAALVLAALTLFTSLAVRPARAAEWMQPYLEQVQEWGVMRGDSSGNLHEDRSITRAEFVTLVNRAFGYSEVGPNTFTDVSPNDWYAEDISIAHQAGYFNGTSPTTAAPLSLVTREQAAVLLGRCLRLQGTTGAAGSSFTDVQDIGGWSRGLVQEAADLGIIQGYADGSFRPDLPITRGQMACFLVRALGTLIQEPGEQSSGGVYGNLTITTPGVKLKDTTVTGNLYLTGGVGLGNVELENVNVLGKIVICGGGEAERGDHSVVLRNVTAGSLEVDSLTEQFLSVQAEGLTSIADTIIRTSAYVEDRTEDGLGLKTIRLDGVEGAQLQLAGNIKEVVNLTPNSALQLAQGVAGVVTMDEKAVGAALTIDVDSYIKELNLDTATPVTGAGSVTHLNINAPGSNVSMLPDTIYVRPGITGNVTNVNMDNKAAAESSDDPRLLAGFPAARNIGPTSADAVFRTNKTGTIRWAVTALMDGSVGEEELMNPSAYPKIIRSGTINATASNTDFTARLTGLTKEGSYYISALLVDARGRRSPVKVAAFTTPDDSAPNFASGYPQAPILTTDADGEQVAQIMVMPTKNCQMYYVLLPKGSSAPTAADFRSAALPGNLGYGVVDLRKNTPFLVSRINTSHLQEKTDYDLYLWLNDADNGKSSTVRKITVTTKDITPPTITELNVKSFTATTVTVRFILDEPGTLSWAAVKQGASIRVDKENPTQYDQIRIEGIPVDGVTVIRRGGPVRAANGGTEYTFTISGLQPQTSYDLYYTAKDTAGNYCVYNKTIEFPYPIRTLDNQPPTAWMDFTDYDEDGGVQYPRLDSDVMIQFSEVVDGFIQITGGDSEDENLEDLYNQVQAATGEARAQAKTALATALQRHLSFHTGTPPGQGNPTRDSYVEVIDDSSTYTAEQLDELPAWIDYREAVITRREVTVPGTEQRVVGTCITFPAGTGIKLQSGGRYFFHLMKFWDSVGNPLNTANLPAFSTASARVDVSLKDDAEYAPDGRKYTILRLKPNEATPFAPESSRWDLVLWAHANIEYDLFVRRAGESDWFQLTPEGHPLRALYNGSRVYHSLFGNLSAQMVASGYFNIGTNEGQPHLRDFTEELEFAILPTEGGQDGNVDMEAEIYTGTNSTLSAITLYGQRTDAVFAGLRTPLERISDPLSYEFTVPSEDFPEVRLVGILRPETDSVRFSVNLNLSGKVFCMAVPIPSESYTSDAVYRVFDDVFEPGYDTPSDPAKNGTLVNLADIPYPREGADDRRQLWVHAEHPRTSSIVTYQDLTGTGEIKLIDTGTRLMNGGGTLELEIPNLTAGMRYILYLVSADESGNPATQALCYRFETNPPSPPKIYIATTSTTQANLQVDKDSTDVKYLLARTYQLEGDSDFSRLFTGSMIKPGVTVPSGVNTVLDAMLTSYPNQTGNFRESVFDHCASQETKDEFSEIIMARQNGDFDPEAITPQDPFDLNRNTPYPITISEMETTSAFTMIVVATGKDSDPGLVGFRASPAFRVTQDRNLYVENYSGGGDNQESGDADQFYSGNFTIRFTDTLCYQIASGKPARIDTCALDVLHPLSANHIATNNGMSCINHPNVITFSDPQLIALLSPAPVSSATVHSTNLIGQQVQFHFTHASDGEQIYFNSLICGTNGEVKANRRSLTVTLKAPDATHSRWWLEFTNGWFVT